MFNILLSERNTFVHLDVVPRGSAHEKRCSSSPPCFKTPVEPKVNEMPAAPAPEVQEEQEPQCLKRWADVEADEPCVYPDEAFSASTDAGSSSDTESSIAEDDQRRTWMLKNLPGRVTKEEVLEAVARLGFGGQHDYFYMPTKLSGNTYVSRGYAFIGFASQEVGDLFREAITGFQFEGRRSAKRIEVTPAHIHNLEDIEQHFKASAVVRTERGPMIGGGQHAQPSAVVLSERVPKTGGHQNSWFARPVLPAAAPHLGFTLASRQPQQGPRHAARAIYSTPGLQMNGSSAQIGFSRFGARQGFQQTAVPR